MKKYETSVPFLDLCFEVSLVFVTIRNREE